MIPHVNETFTEKNSRAETVAESLIMLFKDVALRDENRFTFTQSQSFHAKQDISYDGLVRGCAVAKPVCMQCCVGWRMCMSRAVRAAICRVVPCAWTLSARLIASLTGDDISHHPKSRKTRTATHQDIIRAWIYGHGRPQSQSKSSPQWYRKFPDF